MGDWKILDDSASFMDLELDYGFKVHQMPGLGMAPVENISTPFGLLDGALFQRTRTDVRRFSLNGWIQGATIPDLLSKRKALVELLRSDRFSPQQPVVLQFSGGTTTVQGSAFYDGGMELGDISNNTELDVSIQFVQYDPYWESSDASGAVQSSASLAISEEITGELLVRTNQVWTGCVPTPPGVASTGGWATVDADSSGRIYLGGGGNAASIGYLFQRDPTTGSWDVLAGGVNSNVTALTVAQDDTVFIGYSGTTAYNSSPLGASITATGVVRWLPSSSTFENLTGASGEGVTASNTGTNDVTAARNKVYFVGSWDEMGGACGTTGLAEWDIGASEFSSIGESGSGVLVSEQVRSVDISPNSRFCYVSGSITQVGSATGACNAAYFDLNSPSGDWVYMPKVGTDGFGFGTLSLLSAQDNSVYIGGLAAFTGEQVFLSGNTQSWFNVGEGVFGQGATGGQVNDISQNLESGLIFFIGTQTSTMLTRKGTGGGSMEIGTWDGSRHGQYDIFFRSSPGLIYTNSKSGSDYVVRQKAAPAASTAGITTITNNGTAEAFPTIKITQTGAVVAPRLVAIRNLTTNQNMIFDYDISEQEILTIDLSPGKKTIESSYSGNKIGILEPGSDISTFSLPPGDNRISMFFFIDARTGTAIGGDISASIIMADKFWGIDND